MCVLKAVRLWQKNQQTGGSDSQLHSADQSPEKPHHPQELNPAQVLHRVLLAQVGHSVEDGAEQHQPVAKHHITGCTQWTMAS